MESTTIEQTGLQLIEFHTQPSATAIEFYGFEALSAPFEYELLISTTSKLEKPKALLEKTITLSLHTKVDSAPQYFNGVITNIETQSPFSNITAYYRLKIAPKFDILKHEISYRIFENLTTLEIIKQILQEHNLPNISSQKLTQPYPKHIYCIQYQESTWHFIARLLEEAGIFYYYFHTKDNHLLTLCDNSNISTQPPIHLHYANSCPPGCARISQWNEAVNYTAGTYSHGNLLTSSSNHSSLRPGSCFTFNEQSFLVTKITHRASQQSPRSHAGEQFSDTTRYTNTFSCIPQSVNYFPTLQHKQPIVCGPQTATAADSHNENIHTDALARIKVNFHWKGLVSGTRSQTAWLRLQQRQSGDQWGQQFIPRAGDEVLVNFRHGNPDRPMICKSLHNAANVTFNSLPQQAGLSGVTTQTITNSTRYNAILFDDHAESSKIRMHTDHNLKFEISNNLKRKIHHNLMVTINRGDQINKVLNNTSTVIAQKILLQTGNSRITINTSGIYFKAKSVIASREDSAAQNPSIDLPSSPPNKQVKIPTGNFDVFSKIQPNTKLSSDQQNNLRVEFATVDGSYNTTEEALNGKHINFQRKGVAYAQYLITKNQAIIDSNLTPSSSPVNQLEIEG